MKQSVYLLVVLTLLLACKETKTQSEPSTETEVKMITYDPEGFNQIVPDTVDGGEMLLGRIDRSSLEQELFNEWYQPRYNEHRLDSMRVEQIKPLLAGVTFKVFLGSWCEDSQREVPALFKILDQAGYSTEAVELIAVDHDKIIPQQYMEDYGVEYIPSIIIMKDNSELKRIVEYPVGTLEEDLLTILEGKEYKHYYED